MTCDELQILQILAKHLCSSLRNVLMACAVKSVLSDMIFLVQFIRKSIKESFFRHGLMECCIENSHHGCIRHQFLAGIDSDDVWWVMKWCQYREFFQILHDFIVNDNGCAVLLASVNHSVTYRSDFV